MLRPEYLERLPRSMVELYARVEEDILADMVRRISTYDYWIPAADHQYRAAIEMGNVHDAVMDRLSGMSRKSRAELKRLMGEAGREALAFDSELYQAHGLAPPALAASKELQAVLHSGLAQTNGLFTNLTRTTANTASKQFEDALDRAWLQVSSGAFDYGAAIRTAVKDLSRQGVGAIRYPTGHVDTLEVAVRRATVTGVNQTALKLQEALADEMDCDLVEVTAHAGARPSHAEWQGGVYSRSGKSRTYGSLREATGYGTGEGLGGWNCRHSFFPYFEGSPRTYTPELLRSYEAESYTYNGQFMTEYEASQRQRYIERQIRRWKRENAAMSAAGLDTSESAAKVRQWQETQREFLRQTGLKRQCDRERAAWFGPGEAARADAVFKRTLLPKRDVAVIPQEKFTEYALNPQKSPDKAVAFREALGYDVSTVDSLIAEIRAGLNRFPAIDKGDKGYGMLREVRMEVTGLNGRTAKVITAWIDDKETGEMRLVSAYVDKKKGGLG